MFQDHYAALDVPPDADITLIKRRYRQLVRAHHPDTMAIEERAQAHQTMLALNAAWGVLSSPAERARYDRSRVTSSPRSQTQSQTRSQNFRADEIIIHPPGSQRAWNEVASKPSVNTTNAQTKTATSSRAASTPKTATSSTRSANNGNATTFRARSVDQSGTRKPTPSRLLSMVFEAAELYFFHGRAAEAIAMCESVLFLDANHAEAFALLGDIYEDQNQRATAIQMYARAVQSQPSNAMYRRKLGDLRGEKPVAKNGAPEMRAASDRSIFDDDFAGDFSTNSATSSTRRVDQTGKREPNNREYGGRDFGEEARARAQFGWVLVALSGLFAFLTALRAGANDIARAPFSWLPAAPILADALFCLALAGVCLGAALPMLGLSRRFAMSDQKNAGALAPTMFVVAVVGVSWSPFAPLFALLLSLFYRRWNAGVWCVIGLALILSSALALRAPQFLGDALWWWSGRVALPSLLAGWALGALSSLD